MAIDLKAVGVEGPVHRQRWSSKDALLYALGLGAGVDDLKYTTENTQGQPQKVLPTFAVVIGPAGIPFDAIGNVNRHRTVHGEQGIELFGEIPPEGELETIGKCEAIYDKGSAAVAVFTSESKNVATNELLIRTRLTMFYGGEGGWGGERGPTVKIDFPTRAADHQKTYETREDQALLYRLSGDRNPIHSDPVFAAAGGFEPPLLHGLCTYGITGRGLLNVLCDDDPSRFKSMNARFSKPVFPGDSLTVSMWLDGDKALFRTTNQNAEVVIDQGVFRFEQ